MSAIPEVTQDTVSSVVTSIASESVPEYQQASNRENWSDLTAPGRPFVVRGATEHWPAHAWTHTSLRERFGNVPVLVSRNQQGSSISYYWPRDCHMLEMSFAQFIDCVVDSPDDEIYLWKRDIAQFPGIEADFDFHDIHDPGPGQTFTNIWVGTRGSRSGLHFDRYENVFSQISGSKFVMLFAPEETRRLYPFPDFIERSRLDPESPDFRRFPAFRESKCLSTILFPGDILFIPPLWWHYLRALEPSFSLNYWYGDAASISSLVAAVCKAGPANVAQVTMDFILLGLLRRPEPDTGRPTPTGKSLYTWIEAHMRRRLQR